MGGGTMEYVGLITQIPPYQEYQKEYYQKRRDILLPRQKLYNEENREHIKEYQRNRMRKIRAQNRLKPKA